MKSIVEHFEIKKNAFSRYTYAVLTALSILALLIAKQETEAKHWIFIAAILLFGSGLLMAIKNRIIVYPEGFDFITIGKKQSLTWSEVTALNYNMVYHGHGAAPMLYIHYSKKVIPLAVKQYQRVPVKRFIEILNEQCTMADKNSHFLKLATGQMTFRQKLKMF